MKDNCFTELCWFLQTCYTFMFFFISLSEFLWGCTQHCASDLPETFTPFSGAPHWLMAAPRSSVVWLPRGVWTTEDPRGGTLRQEEKRWDMDSCPLPAGLHTFSEGVGQLSPCTRASPCPPCHRGSAPASSAQDRCSPSSASSEHTIVTYQNLTPCP